MRGRSRYAEIKAETEAAIAALQVARPGVFWVQDMLPPHQVVEALSAATVFVCPSVYEPLGIVNLEAMACNTAVVASDVGGIPEVVVNDFPGMLVHYEKSDPMAFERNLATAVNDIVTDQEKAKAFGDAGRERAVNNFFWVELARQTCELYQSLMKIGDRSLLPDSGLPLNNTMSAGEIRRTQERLFELMP